VKKKENAELDIDILWSLQKKEETKQTPKENSTR
jgi:hypothetical protein